MGVIYNVNNQSSIKTSSRSGVVTDQMRLYYDAGVKASYPGGGSVWYDLSGNGTDLTFYSSGSTTFNSIPAHEAWFKSDSTPGYFKLDGINDWGYFSQFTISTNVSFSAWVRMTDTGTNGLFSHCSGGPVGICYDIVGGYMYYYYYSGGWLSATGTTLVNTGTWKNLVWTKAGTSMKMYVDGVLKDTITLTASVSASMACIASRWGPCNSISYGAGQDSYGTVFDGDIGAIMVHTKELSSTEVVQNYNSLKGRFK